MSYHYQNLCTVSYKSLLLEIFLYQTIITIVKICFIINFLLKSMFFQTSITLNSSLHFYSNFAKITVSIIVGLTSKLILYNKHHLFCFLSNFISLICLNVNSNKIYRIFEF